MKKQLQKYLDNLATLQAFVDKYGDQLPDNFGRIDLHDCMTGKPSWAIYAGGQHCSPDDRNRLLTLVGDVFGRTGWVKEISSRADSFNWQKELEDVSLSIHGAEMIPDRGGKIPVPPNAFPIQLEDAKP